MFVFVALIALIVWLEFDSRQQSRSALAGIHTIEIERDSFATIKLTKLSDEWQMITPYRIGVNATRVEPLLQFADLGNAAYHGDNGYDQAEVDMSATGLLNPAASITFNDTLIALGKPAADGERRYALVNHRVQLLPEWIWSLIHGGVNAFANLAVFADATDLPETLYVISHENDNADQQTIAVASSAWRTLQADKVMQKPDANQTPGDSPATRFYRSSNATRTEETTLADIFSYTPHVVISTGGEFVYVISHETFNALLN